MKSYNWKDSLHIERWPVNSPHKWPLKRMMSSCQDRWLPLGYILNKRLNKQSWGRWFETPSCSLWRHCNGIYRTLGQHLFLYARFFWSINGAELPLANRPISQIPESSSSISTMFHSQQQCAHFGSEWIIVGYGIGAFMDLWNRSIVSNTMQEICHVSTKNPHRARQWNTTEKL